MSHMLNTFVITGKVITNDLKYERNNGVEGYISRYTKPI